MKDPLGPKQDPQAPKQRVASTIVTDNELRSVLDMPAAEIVVSDGDNLDSVLKGMAKAMTESLGKPVVILPNYSELRLEQIESLKDVKLNPVEFPKGAQSYRTVLTAIFSQSFDPDLTYTIESGHFQITTLAMASSMIRTQVYNVAHLLTDVNELKTDTGGLLAKDRGAAALTKLVEQYLQSQYGGDSDELMVVCHGQYLILRGTVIDHHQIRLLLEQLDDAILEGGSPLVMEAGSQPSPSKASPPSKLINRVRGFTGGGLQ